MQTSASVLVSLALLGLPTVATAAVPTPRGAGPRAQPAQAGPAVSKVVARPLTRAQLRPRANPGASAVLADLLVRFADGGGRTKLDTQIARALGPSKREAAKRLVSRWRAASADARRSVFGRAELGGKPDAGLLELEIAKVSTPLFSMLRPTIPLSPEGIPAPSAYQLKLSGIQAIAAHDADGSDELATLVIFATPAANNGFTLTSTLAPAESTIAAPGAATTTIGTTVYDGAAKDMLVITALVEDEGGNAAATRAEIETMVGLAAAVAKTLDGADRLAVLDAMVAYSVGMQDLGTDPQSATRSLASVRIESSDWFALWGVDSTMLDGVPWKLAVPHTIGGGQYELLLDMPSVLPEMTTVKVGIDKFWVEDLAAVGVYKPWQMKLTTTVKGASKTLTFDPKTFSKSWVATYERKVIAGDVPLAFAGSLALRQEFPEGYHADDELQEFCDETSFVPPQCASLLQIVTVDLAPGDTTGRSVTYSTQTNELTGLGKNTLESKGNKARVGGVKIVVTDVAP